MLDPYGLNLDWDMIELGREIRELIDMFLNFPVMDMNRNAIWRDRRGRRRRDRTDEPLLG